MNKESFTNLDSDFESSDESSTNILLHLKKGIGKKEDYLEMQKVGHDKNSVDDWIEIESNNDGLSSTIHFKKYKKISLDNILEILWSR